MPREPRTPRWLPFVTFLAGVVPTASAVLVLDVARGQEREPSRPSAPPDPRSPDEVPGADPAKLAQQEEGITEDPDASGAEQLYNVLGRGRREHMPPLEDVGAPPDPRELARLRFELASRVLQTELQRFLEPPRGGGASWLKERTGPFLEWSRRHVEARLDLAGSDEERIAVLRSEIAHTRALLSTFEALSRGAASSISAMTILEFDIYRLELETRLAELTPE